MKKKLKSIISSSISKSLYFYNKFIYKTIFKNNKITFASSSMHVVELNLCHDLQLEETNDSSNSEKDVSSEKKKKKKMMMKLKKKKRPSQGFSLSCL